MGLPFFPGFSEAALQELTSYHWLGNIRELKNVIERSVTRWGENSSAISTIQIDPFESPYRLLPCRQSVGAITDTPKHSASPPPPDEASSLSLDFKSEVELFEQQLIEKALKKAHFNQRQAAKLLGLTYHQLRGNLKKYNLPKPSSH